MKFLKKSLKTLKKHLKNKNKYFTEVNKGDIVLIKKGTSPSGRIIHNKKKDLLR